MSLAHWDDVQGGRPERPGLGGSWHGLGRAAGSVGVGLNRIVLEPGEVSTPAHSHTSDEEIFFVLSGSGLSWLDGSTHEIRAGDCLVHRARGPAHTLRAGDGGLDVLAYGNRHPVGGAYLPRVGGYWLAVPDVWLEPSPGASPFDREPNLDWPEPSLRPDSILNLDDAPSQYGGVSRRLAKPAGAVQSGLNWFSLPPGEEGAPPHCHAADEELFVILDGEGVLELWAPPRPGDPFQSEPQETHAVRRGHVVARPPGTGIPHSFRAGDAGLTFLAYGTREPNDALYYPRSNKVFLRGLGLIARVEPLAYGDGEPD